MIKQPTPSKPNAILKSTHTGLKEYPCFVDFREQKVLVNGFWYNLLTKEQCWFLGSTISGHFIINIDENLTSTGLHVNYYRNKIILL